MGEPSTYDIDDITRIFKTTKPTVYRQLREVREGRGNSLPSPIPMGPKRRLRWDAEAVKRFIENTKDIPPPSPNFLSATERERRHKTALENLRAEGVKLPTK